MKLDSYNTLIMEHVDWPGNIGDSCAETSRAAHLKIMLKHDVEYNFKSFVGINGFLRHPTAPAKDLKGNSWREDDYSSDQAIVFYIVTHFLDLRLNYLIKETIQEAGWRTGNGDLVTPAFFAFMKNWKWLLTICIIGQALIFKFPWRWNDEKKSFERSAGTSGDYLNWIHYSIYGHDFARKLVKKEILKEKVRAYYKVEPNVEWLIGLYDAYIERFWG